MIESYHSALFDRRLAARRDACFGPVVIAAVAAGSMPGPGQTYSKNPTDIDAFDPGITLWLY